MTLCGLVRSRADLTPGPSPIKLERGDKQRQTEIWGRIAIRPTARSKPRPYNCLCVNEQG